MFINLKKICHFCCALILFSKERGCIGQVYLSPQSTSHCVSSKFTLGINKYFIQNSSPPISKGHALLSSDGDVLTLYVFPLCIENGVKRSYRLDFRFPCLSKYSVNTIDRTHKQFQLDIPILVL